MGNDRIVGKGSGIAPLAVTAVTPLDASTKRRERLPTRFYFHGDAVEGQEGAFYCVKCDAFVPEVHFRTHDGQNMKALRRSEREWSHRLPWCEWYRPDDVFNCVVKLTQGR